MNPTIYYGLLTSNFQIFLMTRLLNSCFNSCSRIASLKIPAAMGPVRILLLFFEPNYVAVLSLIRCDVS